MDRHHIIGKIAESDGCQALHPLFGKAFAFLKRDDLATLPLGRHDIDGDRCWANIQEVELAAPSERKLEAHRRFIDIQAPITGCETIGLAEMDAAALALPFDVEKDFVLYDGPSRLVTLAPGDFAIFFPPLGAHAPCCRVPGGQGPARIRKVVVKVAAAC